jgi:hypothetical protein
MSKKLYGALLPILAVTAFAMAPAVAQAQLPHWYSCEASSKGKFENTKCTKAAPPEDFEWVRIKAGTKEKPNDVQVTTKGTLVLHAPGVEITCTVKDAGSIWNPAGGGAGEDEITEFTNSGCKAVPAAACEEAEILALNLPWYSRLLVGPPIRDEIYAEVEGVKKGIEIEVRCKKAKLDVFAGILTPEVTANAVVFGMGSGELEDAAKNKATVTGTDELEGPAGDRGITAKTP